MTQEHTALYRKYRPQDFKEVRGQEQIVAALQGALKDNAISHAYLFAGTRGTGKTSVARIFARAIGVAERDLYEIDAASNRGIDDVRELREAVQALPFESPYKLYIIDEAHMLTKEAFNALLKTLEEPPAHAVFVLATTEMHKLPDTVISRCETHHFRQPSQKILRTLVEETAKREGYTIAPDGAELVALLGDGSFRDAHGVLQKVFSGVASTKVSAEDVARLTGAPPAALVRDVLTSLSEGDAERGLTAIEKAAEQNTDMQVFARLILARLRAVLLLRFAKKSLKDMLAEELSDEELSFLTKHAEDETSRITAATLEAFLDATAKIGFSAVPHLPLELALITLLGQSGDV